jgi:hypothetical protein
MAKVRSQSGPLRLAALAAALACLAAPGLARAESTFIARVDRTQVALGQSFILEVTLSLETGGANNYRLPDLRGFDILAEVPSQSMQMMSGSSGAFMRTAYSWRYELQPRKEGRFTIGPARVRVEGRELHTDPLAITVVPAGARQQQAAPQPQRRGSRSPFDDFFDDGAPAPQQPAAGSFVRAVADKTKAYVGEAVTVEWFLYLAERQDNYRTTAEPRTDGFWSEDLSVPGTPGHPTLTQQTYEGRSYQVAPLMRKALFPLQPGKLTVTPLESELAQVDLFGRSMRTQRLKAEPLTIEALPLPPGQPDGFDPANVGRFTVEARLDRDRVTVGEAVTLTFDVRGEGNLRKLAPPRLPPLAGWKMYEPKVEAKIDPNTGVVGSKSIEYLMLPERAGTTIVPAIELAFFDPATRSYGKQQSQPLRITVVADGAAAPRHGNPATVGTPVAGVENVLPSEIRPLRARPALQRDLGTTFYQSRLFGLALVLPPFAFGLTLLVGRVREKLSKETERGRRRKTRKLVRQRLRAAEEHLEASRAAAFTIELDRVLREVLTARLGGPIAGLSRDELKAAVGESGLGPQLAERVNHELEECDRARFAPGSMGAGDMRAQLERAAELIDLVEKAPVRPSPEVRP